MISFQESLSFLLLEDWELLAPTVLPIMYQSFIKKIDKPETYVSLVTNLEMINNEHILYAFIIKRLPKDIYNQLSRNIFKSVVSKEKIIEKIYKDKKNNSELFLVVKKQFEKKEFKITPTVIHFDTIIGPKERFYELLDYQVSIKERVLSHIQQDIPFKRLLVHMPTGTGKTKTSMHIVVKYQNDILKNDNCILWIAHTNTLLEQALDTYTKVWDKLGYGESDICNYYGATDIPDYFQKGIIFASVTKLINAYKNNKKDYIKLLEHCELIIFDEAHKCVAQETQYMLNDLMRLSKNVKSRSLIGLTATPGRNIYDHIDNDRLALMFDKTIISIDPKVIEHFTHQKPIDTDEYDMEIIHYFQSRGILSKLNREELHYKNILTNEINKKIKSALASKSEDLPKEVVRYFEENVQRNEVIINKLVELNNNHIATIVFACSVEHGRFLTNMLKMKNIQSKEVYGSTNNEIRRQSIKEFKNGEYNILINCNVLTTGFDSTNIRCVFITRPTKSVVLYSQMIGRGLRGKMMGGNEECLLIDLKDNLGRFDNESSSFNVFKNYWG